MKSFRSLAAAAAILLAAPATSAGQGAPALMVRPVRFWSQEYRQTVVKAFVQIPYIALTPTSNDRNGVMSYRVTVRVADSTGLTLMQQSWAKRAQASARGPGTTGFEILEFAVAPGQYQLELTVDDSVSGTRLTKTMPLQGFGDWPGASDLVISPRMRIPGPEDTIPVQGELRRGNTVFTASADVRLSPMGDRSKLYYYLEGYSQQADSGTLGLEVRDQNGSVVLKLPPRPVQVAAGGGVVRGQIDLTGLPEGAYEFHAALMLGGRTVERGASFRMGDMATALVQMNTEHQLAIESDSGYFAEMSPEQLDEAFAPLSYISNAEDHLSVWTAQLTANAKRQFLVNFWHGRDPSPQTPKNEAREAFYARIDEANQKYTDQQRGSRAGWRTDMGRVYIRSGEPTEKLARAQVGTASPYTVWRYAGARDFWYIFVDRTNFGSFDLVASNDPKEPGRPGWESQIGPNALDDVGRFLNIDFVRRGRTNTQ